MTDQSKGEGRACDTCLLYHPERTRKPCSVFVRCVSSGSCAAYIQDKAKPVEGRT